MSAGFVYIAATESLPGIIKIGYTRSDPKRRAKTLSGSVPLPYVIFYKKHDESCCTLEYASHQELKEFRVTPNREFFRVDVEIAIRTIKNIASQLKRNRLAKEKWDAEIKSCKKLKADRKKGAR